MSMKWSQFVQKHRFQHVGVFTYSYEADTPSAKLPDHIDDAGQRSSPRTV